MVVLHSRQQVSQFRQLVIMRGEESFGVGVSQQIFHHRPGDGEAVKCGRAAPDFIEQHKTAGRGGVENRRRFGHLHHEG